MIKNGLLSILAVLAINGLQEANAQSHRGQMHNGHPSHHDVDKHGHANHTYAHRHGNYDHLPRYRSVVGQVPAGALAISFRGINYYYHSSIYYRHSNNGYCITNAPIGIRLRTLPVNYTRVMIGPSAYYYYYGSYYQQDPQTLDYYSTPPPIGATVNALPAGSSTVTIDGSTFYELGGTYYKANLTESGEVWYEVVGQK